MLEMVNSLLKLKALISASCDKILLVGSNPTLLPKEMISTNQEEWKPIMGFTNYQVSNLGRVRNMKFNSVRIMKPWTSHGYKRIKLSNNNKRTAFAVHRLVAIMFVKGRSYERCIVNHIDGVRDNNKMSNLEWVTYLENSQHQGLKLSNRVLPMYVHKVADRYGWSVIVPHVKVFKYFHCLNRAKLYAKEFYVYESALTP